MGESVIPLADLRVAASVPRIPETLTAPNGLLADALGRPLHDLRISVTDRCNFRCSYCMPKEVFDKQYSFLPQSSLLSFEEITRLARIFVGHGVHKLRLTGGEPTLRKHLETLIQMLAELRTPAGEPLDITLDHQRHPARTQGRGAQGRRAQARDGQPGCAGRRASSAR